jgi:hypothetical protein
MKKYIRSFITFAMIFGISFWLNLNTAHAASTYSYSIGTDYSGFWPWENDINSSNHAIYTANGFKQAGFTGYYNTAPTYQYLRGSYNGYKRMESSILYFGGHANNALMTFNYKRQGGDYKTGVADSTNYTTSDGYVMTGIRSYDMSKVHLIVFQGCDTASTSNNITKSAVSLGAETAIGWTDKISDPSNYEWIKNFTDKIEQDGVEVWQATQYADSKNYSDIRVKLNYIYGNPHLIITHLNLIAGSSVTSYNQSQFIDTNEYKPMIKLENVDSKNRLDLISSYIKSDINEEFNIDNYNIESVQKGSRMIIDITQKLYPDIRTNSGYTVFIDDNKVTSIFDNNKLNREKSTLTIDFASVLSNFGDEKIKTLALNNIDKDKYKILNNKIFNYYDVDKGELYKVVRTEIENKEIGTFAVIDYKHKVK